VLTLTEETSKRVTSGLPDWARSRASVGYRQFSTMDMPNLRSDLWRHADLDVDLDALLLALGPGPQLGAGGVSDGVLASGGRALSVDGFTVAAGSSGGMVVTSLSAAMKDHGEAVRLALGPASGEPLDRFSALHDAFAADGVFLLLPRGVRAEGPVVVDLQATVAGSLAVPRLIVVAEEDSAGAVVVQFRSPEGVPLVVVSQVVVSAGPGSNLEISVVQEWGDSTYAVTQQALTAGPDASLEWSEAGLGGRNSRTQLRVGLDGAGSRAAMFGLFFGEGSQTLDYRCSVDHRAPGTTSDLFLKGAVGQRSRSVFAGAIRVEPAGQQSSARQTNRNLVLSEGAQAHSMPNLEILADDVKCGHGSTVGSLDAEQRYYLMSRGLRPADADRLQVAGYFGDLLGRLPRAELRAPLRREIMGKYARVAGEAGT
jgi:Fe-S cluster assembly protein SufD